MEKTQKKGSSMTRRGFIGVAAGGAVGLAIGGIAGRELFPKVLEAPPPPAPEIGVPMPELGPVTVSIAAGRPDSGVIAVNIPEFEAQTGIEVRLEEGPWESVQEKISMDLMAGVGRYDVIWLPTSWAVNWEEYLVDLKPRYDKLPEAYKEDYFPRTIELNTFDGKLLGLPFKFWALGLFYRKDVIEGLGLSLPKTMDDYAEVLKAVTMDVDGDGKIDQWGTAVTTSGFLCLDHYLQYCNAFFDPKSGQPHAWSDVEGKPTLDADWNIEALQWLVDRFVVDKSLPPQSLELVGYDNLMLFLSRQLGFYPGYGCDYIQMADPAVSQVVDYWDVAPTPVGPHGVQLGHSGGQGLGIPTTSKHQDGAWLLIKYVCGVEGVKNEMRYCTLECPRKSAYEIPEAHPKVSKVMLTAMLGDPETGTPAQMPSEVKTKAFAKVGDFLTLAVYEAFSQKKTAEKALKDAQEASLKELEKT